MSGLTSAPRFFRPAAVPVAAHRRGPLLAWARAFMERVALMRRASETRRELGSLNPRLLSDIGVTRAEAEREAERWPWDIDGRHPPGRGHGAHW